MKTALCLLLSAVSACAVTLTWDLNKETYLAGYIVHWGVESGAPTQHIDVGKVSSWTHDTSGYDAHGATIYYVVTAYNTKGTVGRPSNEVFYEVLPKIITIAVPVMAPPPPNGYSFQSWNTSGLESTSVISATYRRVLP